MVFKRQSDNKQSHENQNHNMQEPYMSMPQAGRSFLDPRQQQGQSSDSRAMTGPLHDPRKDVPAQQPHAQNPMYNNPQYNQYVGQVPQQSPYLNAYGAPQQQPSMMNQQYRQDMQPRQNVNNTNYTPQNTTPPQQEDLKGLSFWQEDTENTYHDEAEDNDDSASPMKFVLTILALVVVSVILWLGYRFATQPQNSHIPLIQAETGIYKHRPENPGGEYFPHQDMHVYNRLTPHQQTMGQQERILPQDYAYPTQEEMQQQEYYQQQAYGQQQQDHPIQEQQNYPAQAQQNYLAPEQQYNQYQNYQEPAQSAPYGQQNFGAVEQRVQQQSEQPVVQQEKIVPIQETIPSVAEVKKNIAEQAVANKESKQGIVDPESKVVEPLKKKARVDSADTFQMKPLTVGYYMQLGGMLPSDKSAKNEWDRIRRKFTTELGDYKPILRSVDAGVKKKYRLLVGPFSNRNNALKKCMRVGNGCRVVQVG